jgi:Flp pilus assembly protein RcpC/CpaB/SAF domain
MIGFAVVFGLLAVFIAQAWLNNQASMQAKNMEANKKPVAMQTVVVAKEPLRFGTELTAAMLKEVPWPADALPSGAYSKISDVLHGGRRVVLTAIEKDEPVLPLKITGPGERATLSALVHKGMKAVTIRVNDVEGVGGFVLPGDRVDVVLTRISPRPRRGRFRQALSCVLEWLVPCCLLPPPCGLRGAARRANSPICSTRNRRAPTLSPPRQRAIPRRRKPCRRRSASRPQPNRTCTAAIRTTP